MLTVSEINLDFGKTSILRDISFDISKGEVICLAGPSGSGKTSLLRLIAGLENPVSGEIYIDDKLVSSKEYLVEAHKREVGLLFQDLALFPHLTVEQNIKYGLGAYTKSSAKQRAKQLLETTQLSRSAVKFPHMLSGGEQQRVALARAWAPNPKILLLDEPFSSLDTALKEQIREDTYSFLRDNKITAIIVTHDPLEALSMSDRIVLINEGKIVQVGKPEEIYEKPVDRFAAEFFGNINAFEGRIDKGKITTKIGEFRNTTPFDDGVPVDVLVRNDALTVELSQENQNGVQRAWVCESRYMGEGKLLRIGVGNWPEPHTHLNVNYFGNHEIRHGQPMKLTFNDNRIFVFLK